MSWTCLMTLRNLPHRWLVTALNGASRDRLMLLLYQKTQHLIPMMILEVSLETLFCKAITNYL